MLDVRLSSPGGRECKHVVYNAGQGVMRVRQGVEE